VELFRRHGVLSEVELKSRREILFENYSKVVNIEAQTMILMASRQIIPAVESYIELLAGAAKGKMDVLGNAECAAMERDIISKLSKLNSKVYSTVSALRAADAEATAAGNAQKSAVLFRDKVIPIMNSLRAAVDEMETMVASDCWPLPTYGEMTYKQ
jgi:glutamine synthetase